MAYIDKIKKGDVTYDIYASNVGITKIEFKFDTEQFVDVYVHLTEQDKQDAIDAANGFVDSLNEQGVSIDHMTEFTAYQFNRLLNQTREQAGASASILAVTMFATFFVVENSKAIQSLHRGWLNFAGEPIISINMVANTDNSDLLDSLTVYFPARSGTDLILGSLSCNGDACLIALIEDL